MSDHKNLSFFNKKGDNLNFRYDEESKIFQGDILFDVNSTDTFKTFGLYTFEKVKEFEFESGEELATNKFQLFNEFGIHFYESKLESVSLVEGIEPVNNDPSFYSKWIYGNNFESIYPIGTLISFRDSILEFTNPNQIYSVIGSKKGAIMIISGVDNSTFEIQYYSQYSNANFFNNKAIFSINAIGVYNYINSNYENNISLWSEPDFYDKIYNDKRINVVNSDKNNGVYTVSNSEITDLVHYEYLLNILDVPINSEKIIIEVLIGTDLPRLYDGGISITNNKITLSNSIAFPSVRGGQEIKIVGSLLNSNFLIVADIPEFYSNNTTHEYILGEQVIYNGKVYQCILPYIHSHGDDSTRYITPDDILYWSNADYILVEDTLVDEDLLNAQLYLTKEKYYFEQDWADSSAITLATMADKFKDSFLLFNIDLYYSDGYLKSDLVYPSKYVTVNYYIDIIDESNKKLTTYKTNERLIGVKEPLKREFNYDYSSLLKYNIVFTDLDEYGLKVVINNQVYDIEVVFVYSGNAIDMNRTIDKTLRAWLTRNYLILLKLGINAELQFVGNYTSVFYNSILLVSEYPNVPMIVDDVLVGSTANSYIEHSKVLFKELGPYLDININNKSYLVTSESTISATLKKWVDEFSIMLLDKGIIVSNFNSLLKFDINSSNNRLDYFIKNGNLNLPGIKDFKITNKIKGNLGVLLASNEVILEESSDNTFIDVGFSTGMVFSINNTFYTWVNQEYTIEYLDNNILNLSYEGPFWDVNNFRCYKSPFVTVAFDSGFGLTGCGPITIPGKDGEFDILEFDLGEFNMIRYPNTYDVLGYDGVEDMVDIKYVQLSNTVLAFGKDISILDSYFGEFITKIVLPSNIDSIKMEYNQFNDYMYCLSKSRIWVIDPLINNLITEIPLVGTAVDLIIDPNNGNVYISYSDRGTIDIFKSTSFSSTPDWTNILPSSGNGLMVFNSAEDDVYIMSNLSVFRISANIIKQTYTIPNLGKSIFFEPSGNSVIVDASPNLYIIKNNIVTQTTFPTSNFIDIIYNSLSGDLMVSTDNDIFSILDLNCNIIRQSNLGSHGYLALNPYDGGVYLSSRSLNSIIVIDSMNPDIAYSNSTGENTTRLIYNPDRKSIWAIQPISTRIIEIEVNVNIDITENLVVSESVSDNMFGTLDPEYVVSDNMWLKSRDFYRRPRENYRGDVPVDYYFKWLSDNVDEFFLYDFSGDQLEKGTSFSYIGETPLNPAVLNRNVNKDLNNIDNPLFQQTIFNKVEHRLSYIDDINDTSSASEPIQTFIGFRSDDEGALRSILQLYKREKIEFRIIGDADNEIRLSTIVDDNDKRGIISINPMSVEVFTNRGLKPGQQVTIYLTDNTNEKNQYISYNSGTIVTIREVFTKTIIVDFINKDNDALDFESTTLINYPKNLDITYLTMSIKVRDKEIGRFFTYGQTEEEDIRFKIELGNIGKLIEPDDVFIFKEYDVEEGGIDWTYLNKKRKEMLMMKHLIYPYIGAYKSIINAINFFGYNDLQLNEYYRDVDTESSNFGKLFKVEIPDIFDNSVEGWTSNDFLENTMPNDKYDETNLFNLTYPITDKEGNNILNYSVDEVIIKLQGLKYWLKKNIIPLTHKIMDITGSVYFSGGTQITHKLNDVRIHNINDNMSPISFKLNEAYLMPVNSGSTVYNCVLDFYSIIPNIGADKTLNGLIDAPKPFHGKVINLPDYFNIKIRSYKTYKEWAPFKSYKLGDKVSYYGRIYESTMNNNKVNSPKKYDLVDAWVSGKTYSISDIVSYKRQIYAFSKDIIPNNFDANKNPFINVAYWTIISSWKEINLEPVQTITEYRDGNNLLPFNFTIDSNLDPFITIEVTSDNGYGCIYSDKKNYELRGIKDLVEPYSQIEPIGPFVPINLVLNTKVKLDPDLILLGPLIDTFNP